mmetsp:Transcript_2199/g.4974  ORF Transcript_2199/g.4974 Transcript_2199/m.4974 type:complete len:255 (-) Transcript_2199:71-835(-)
MSQRRAALDPFYLVRDEIAESLHKLTESFTSWERMPHGDKAKVRAADDLSSRLGDVEAMVADVAAAVQKAAENPARFHIDADEVKRRQQWVDGTRSQIRAYRSKIDSSKMVVNVETGSILNALRAGSTASSAPRDGGGAAAALERERERDNDDFLDAQERTTMQMMREQDSELDELGGAVRRLGDVGLTIGRELEEQQVMLEELEEDVETTRGKLKAAQRKMEKLLEKAGMRGQICIILFLMIVLVVLSYFVFS